MHIQPILQDLRFALRRLRHAPLFGVSAALTLALGIGVNAGIFGLLNGLLRPLPVPNGDRIVVIAAEFPSDDTGFRHQFSYPEIADYRAAREAFADVFGFHNQIAGLTVSGTTTPFVYHVVTGGFFPGLELRPTAGRFFGPGEGDRRGGEAIVVLGYGCWQRRFGGDPAVVGTVVRLDGQPARIVGISPPGFHGLAYGVEIDGYVPAGSLRGRAAQAENLFVDRSLRLFTMVARLRDGVRLASAQAAAEIVASRLQTQYPDTERRVSARVMPEWLARPVPSRFLAGLLPAIYASLFGLASLVLLIACLNVANLLLVRAAARQRELAVRAALGSGRRRLVHLLLAESALLAWAGMAAGLVLARWATDLLLAAFNPAMDVPLHLRFDYDWLVFAYASLAAVATTVIVGIVPAVRASRPDVTSLLHDGGSGASAGRGRQRLRRLLVVAQVGGSLVLLVVAGLCVRGLERARAIDPGFDPNGLLTVRLDPRQIGYDPERTATFYDELDRRLRALPGVEAVSASFSVPMGYLLSGCRVRVEGAAIDGSGDSESTFGCNPVGPDYFGTLRLPILRGRAFSTHDTDTSEPVVIVNDKLARRLWPDGDAVGKRVLFPSSPAPRRVRRVVGVARDSKYVARFESPLPFVYVAMKQEPSSMRVLYVRASVPPERLATLVRREIHQLDAGMPIADLKTMRQTLDGELGFLVFRLGTLQAAGMGLLGLLLAGVGIYGVVSYGASQRTREIGIRIALGADPTRVARLVLLQGAALVLAGLAAGLVIAAIVARTIASYIPVVVAADPATVAGVTMLLAAIALAACYLPARRASRVDPLVALRRE